MPVFDLNAFYQSLRNANTLKQVDEAFKTVFALPPAERKAVGEELERKYLSFSTIENIAFTKGIAAAEEHVRTNASMSPMNPDYDQDIARRQKLVQIRVNVARLRGKEASYYAQVFNAAAQKLTAAEYQSPAVYEKPLLAVVKAIAQLNK